MGGPPMANSGNSIQTQRHIRGYFGCLKLGGGLNLKLTLLALTVKLWEVEEIFKHLKDDSF